MLSVFYPEPGPQASGAERETPSRSAARCQGLWIGPARVGGGVISARNCSSAATMASASPSEAGSVTSSIRGRGGRRFPFELTAETLARELRVRLGA